MYFDNSYEKDLQTTYTWVCYTALRRKLLTLPSPMQDASNLSRHCRRLLLPEWV